jgi:hypothetical protein
MTEETKLTVVQITLQDVYREQQAMKKLLEQLANGMPNTDQKLVDHETRIRKLETRVGWAVGSFGLLAALSPFLTRLIP